MSLRDKYIEAVEAENDALRERIAILETLLGFRVEVPLVFNLTAQEAKLFGLLLKRDLVTKEAGMVALYGSRPDGDVAEEKIVDVFVCKMRPKLKAWGIVIETKWGQGYYLSAESKAKARAMLPKQMEAA
jgi:DNA-binding response OmpR family regulator